MEALKQRIKIFITVFQYGMTLFLGIGVSFVGYINRRMEHLNTDMSNLKWDIISITHALLMVLFASIAIFFLVEADKVNDDLFEHEETLKVK